MNQANSISYTRTDIPPPTPIITNKYQINGVLRAQKTKQELAKYLSGTLFNPRPSTLLPIRCNNLLTFPGLTTKLIINHLPESEASLKGHLTQEQKNLRSTKTPSQEEDNEDLHRKQEPDNIKTNKMLRSMFPISDI